MYDVVLVDDEQIILQGLARVFPWANYGCQVVDTAVDGQQGLAIIRSRRPHILLTDIRMPNLDGLSMIAALKSEFPEMQISVLTAFRDFDYAQRAIQLGVCRYLLKPSRMEALHEAVAAMTAALNEAAPAQAEGVDEDSETGSYVARSAVRYIEQHCTEHLSLSAVADSVYVSQWHLSKLINRYARQSFFDLLNQYRVKRSQELLADPKNRVSEIAFAVGYVDVAHFSRIFKKVTGKTPIEYRHSLR